MLHSVNLLPWREEQRVARQKRLLELLVLVAVFALVTVWLMGAYLEHQITAQQKRNQFLDDYAFKLEQQIKQQSSAEQQHQALLTRIAMVEALQKQRNQTTEFLNLLPKLIPQGVYVDKLKVTDQQVELEGIADSTSRLAQMLDKLERSDSVTSVEMHSIVHGVKRFAKKYQSFRVSFSLLGDKA